MVVFYHIMEVLHLADSDRRAVRRIILSNGRRIGLAAVNSNRFRDLMAKDGLCEETCGGLLIPLLGQQEIR